MTPQERQLIDDLFDRLAKLENAPRDPEAMSAIMQGLRKAPNARLCAGADRAGAGRGAEARQRPHPGTGSGARRRTEPAIRRLPRSRCATRSSGRTSRSSAAQCRTVRAPRHGLRSERAGLEQRTGDAAVASAGTRLWPAGYGQPLWPARNTVSLMVSRRSAAVAARSSEPRRRRRPAWSVARLLLGSIRSHDGRRRQPAGVRRYRRPRPATPKPSRGATSPSSDLARDAGINDIGSSGGQRGDN